MPADDVVAAHDHELRRGSVVLACLLRLRRPGYGYGLLEALRNDGIETDANTLYPLLRRLERQGLLTSEWNTDDTRPRKYYETSPAGTRLAGHLLGQWRDISAAIDRIANGGHDA